MADILLLEASKSKLGQMSAIDHAIDNEGASNSSLFSIMGMIPDNPVPQHRALSIVKGLACTDFREPYYVQGSALLAILRQLIDSTTAPATQSSSVNGCEVLLIDATAEQLIGRLEAMGFQVLVSR
jgi:hypothetical protein